MIHDELKLKCNAKNLCERSQRKSGHCDVYEIILFVRKNRLLAQ